MKYYIRDGRSIVGNCVLWWKPNREGYTTNLDEAGKYSYEEALSICSNNSREDTMHSCAYVLTIANLHVDVQKLK